MGSGDLETILPSSLEIFSEVYKFWIANDIDDSGLYGNIMDKGAARYFTR